MQIEVEVFETIYNGITQGDIHFSLPNSKGAKEYGNIGYKYLGTTMIDIKEPKRKKLVYQWLWEGKDNELHLTNMFYGLDERIRLRDHSIGKAFFKEGGILRPLMESEKEIDV